ncbi:MAG TPA: hypothetical protein V6C65_22375 [Allocoleopsis sp.]
MNTANYKRAFGVFSKPQQVETSFRQLHESDFPMNQVSIVVKQADGSENLSGATVSDQVGDQNVKTPMGVVKDALTFSTWGFVLAGLTSLALPGVGPVLAAGSLGAALVTTTAGTGVSALATNNLVKALSDLGIPKEQAGLFSDRLLQGDYFVMVEGTSDQIDQAEQAFSDQGIRDWVVYPA